MPGISLAEERAQGAPHRMAKRRFSDVGMEPGAVSARSSAYVARRRSSAAACLSSASAALTGFTRGSHIFGLTKGQFSMIDLAAAVLGITGPADLAVWTWCIAEYEVEAVSAFIADGRIRRFRIVMDWTGAQRDMPLVGDLQARFGLDCIRVTKTHAKIVTLSTDDGWRVTIRGSMNLNANPRFEQFDVSDCEQTYGVVEGVMTEMWRNAPALAVREMAHHQAVASRGAGSLPDWAPSAAGWWA